MMQELEKAMEDISKQIVNLTVTSVEEFEFPLEECFPVTTRVIISLNNKKYALVTNVNLIPIK